MAFLVPSPLSEEIICDISFKEGMEAFSEGMTRRSLRINPFFSNWCPSVASVI